MRKLFFAFLFTPFISFAQERTDVALPVISNTVLWSLKSADGWMFNKEGKWIQGKNKIQKEHAGISEKPLWDTYQTYMTGTDNFNSFELREIKINGVKYFILIKTMKDGLFKYDAIKKGWQTFSLAKYLVFSMPDTTNSSKTASAYQTSTKYFGSAIYIKPDYINRIALDINKKQMGNDIFSDDNELSLQVLYKIEKAKCRFYIQAIGKEGYDKLNPMYGTTINALPMTSYYYETATINALDDLLKYLKPTTIAKKEEEDIKMPN